MASLLEANDTRLPKEAIYLIRYHSFYAWHTPITGARSYAEYASDEDWKMLPLLKAFQKSDLYSKTCIIPEKETIKNQLTCLVEKWIGPHDLNW